MKCHIYLDAELVPGIPLVFLNAPMTNATCTGGPRALPLGLSTRAPVPLWRYSLE